MKLLHIADLHIGKSLNQKSLIDEQIYLLDEVIKMMKDNNVSTLLISGDVYDKQIPSQEAVKAFNTFLNKAIIENKFKVFIISGNHDSSERLNFASDILKSEGLYIETFATSPIKKITVTDEFGNINIYMMPYATPLYTRLKYDCDVKSFADAIRYYLDNTEINYNERNILMTHHTVLHYNNALFSDSEVRFNIGGTEGIDASTFKDFDYVALGHLHNPQYLLKESIRYSGSIFCYSESEIPYKKNAILVDLKEKGNIAITPLYFHPINNVIKLEGFIDDLLLNIDQTSNDFVYVTLLDKKIIPNAMQRLRVKYPNAVSLVYKTSFVDKAKNTIKVSENFHDLSYEEQFSEFYEAITNNKLNDNQEKMINKIIKKVVE